MKCRITIRWKRLKAIPRFQFFISVILFLSFIYCTVNALIPSSSWMKHTESKTIAISNVSLYDSRNLGTRFKLTIRSQDGVFYLWYPCKIYRQHEDDIQNDLMNGSTSYVTVTYLSNSSLCDLITGHCKIVDLRSDNTVFYDLKDEISRENRAHIYYVILSVILIVVCLLNSFFVLLIYNCISFRKRMYKKRG